MNFQKKYLVVFLPCITLIILTIVCIHFWRYSIYLPFILEKALAQPSRTPEEVFSRFQKTLKDRKDNSYLKYITKETRDQYRKLLSDPKIRQKYLQPLVNVQEQYTVDCDNKLTCEKIAVYSYDYIISEPYWEEIAGKRYLIPVGIQRLEMRFIEIKKGYWQLNEF